MATEPKYTATLKLRHHPSGTLTLMRSTNGGVAWDDVVGPTNDRARFFRLMSVYIIENPGNYKMEGFVRRLQIPGDEPEDDAS